MNAEPSLKKSTQTAAAASGSIGEYADAIAQLKSSGWCVVPNVLDADQTRTTLVKLWAAKARYEDRFGSAPQLQGDTSVRISHLMALDDIFCDLIQHPLAVAFVRELLGEKFLIGNFVANIARPGSRSMPLHSDQSLVVPEPWHDPWAVNVIWCLTDTYFENGSTLFIPGSHLWRTNAEVPSDAMQRLRPFEAKAGSFIVMDGRMWHTSGCNVTETEDRALMFGFYTRQFIRPQVNWNALLAPEIRASFSSEMQTWLGLGIDGNRLGAEVYGKSIGKSAVETR